MHHENTAIGFPCRLCGNDSGEVGGNSSSKRGAATVPDGMCHGISCPAAVLSPQVRCAAT